VLTRLRLLDFVLAREIDLPLGAGLTCLTGETGAGKSVLVDALATALGGRAGPEVVRAGAARAVVEAFFEGPGVAERLEAIGLEAEDALLLRREIGADARSRGFANGTAVTLKMMRAAAEGLVEITGQGEHHALLRPETHEALLDASAGLADARGAVGAAYRRYADVARALHALASAERDRLARQDLLAFQADELERAAVESPGELEALVEERRRLRGTETLRRAALEAAGELTEAEGAAVDRAGRAEARVAEAAAIDPALEPALEALARARESMQETALQLERYAARVAADPERLGVVEDRIDLLRRLCRKHGGDLAAVVQRRAELDAERNALAEADERIATLERSLADAREAAIVEARGLSRARGRAAGKLAAAVGAELEALGLGAARFEVQVDARPAPRAEGDLDDGVIPPLVCDGARVGPSGRDRVAFVLAPNPGENAGPLERIASGGERARVALAVHLAIGARDPAAAYVFDEIDAGIGGRVASAVAERLQRAAQQRQVLCVTHLPQLAALADTHVRIEKQDAGGRTEARAEVLDRAARTEELARMLGGAKVTARTRAHAEEMLRRPRTQAR